MINIYIIFPISILCFAAGGGIVWHIFTHPEILDKWASCFHRLFKAIYKEADKRFVKYNIQSTINGFIAKLNSDVPHLVFLILMLKGLILIGLKKTSHLNPS